MKNDKIKLAYEEMIVEDKKFILPKEENINLLKQNFKDLTTYVSWISEDLDRDILDRLRELIAAVKSNIDQL